MEEQCLLPSTLAPIQIAFLYTTGPWYPEMVPPMLAWRQGPHTFSPLSKVFFIDMTKGQSALENSPIVAPFL